mmetsp:Transcript_9463/g.14267  ORF Transcript_9463/g.14267 Transcript_9463/m.14267 type:complete len:181 (-) Transcript_9463:182-724(-)
MNIISKPDLSKAAQYGRYVDFIPSKKGCHTPVRRSCRNKGETAHNNKVKADTPSLDDNRDDCAQGITKTPVKQSDLDDRHSCRNRRGTPHYKVKDETTSADDNRDDCVQVIKRTPLKQCDLDDLCTIFQQTLKVDNHSLEVTRTDTKVLSPEPTSGRYITAKFPDESATITPVKRSTRNI